jgi:hypothetical protein
MLDKIQLLQRSDLWNAGLLEQMGIIIIKRFMTDVHHKLFVQVLTMNSVVKTSRPHVSGQFEQADVCGNYTLAMLMIEGFEKVSSFC